MLRLSVLRMVCNSRLRQFPPGGVVPKFIDPRLAAGDGIYGLGWRSPERKGESGIVTVLAPLGGDPPLAPAFNGRRNSAPAVRRGFFCRRLAARQLAALPCALSHGR
jgi:hypothetical protein